MASDSYLDLENKNIVTEPEEDRTHQKVLVHFWDGGSPQGELQFALYGWISSVTVCSTNLVATQYVVWFDSHRCLIFLNAHVLQKYSIYTGYIVIK